ncbi:hypothetical protein QFC21_000678 [Naganishia friedmannii]|uniref:Uncharacterized protein n=1 Tax=Naganishia friedmannii TaxID=89922 RepID=A0ACC2WDS5_9TREE|nr:hypothetical protein QFC21_000678 [Naganishia friedmannii]
MPQPSTSESVSLAPSPTLTDITLAPLTKRGGNGEETGVRSIATASAEKWLGRKFPTVVEPPSSDEATVASNIEPNRKKRKTRGGAGGSKQGGTPRKVEHNTLKVPPKAFTREFTPEGESSDDESQEQPPVLGRGLWQKRDEASHPRASSLSIKPGQ